MTYPQPVIKKWVVIEKAIMTEMVKANFFGLHFFI
jgi:hypothetical protein